MNKKFYILCFFAIILFLFFKQSEGFGWTCVYTPNKDYYKEPWLLGGTMYEDRLDSYLRY